MKHIKLKDSTQEEYMKREQKVEGKRRPQLGQKNGQKM